MYTGIVQTVAPIRKLTRNPGHLAFDIELSDEMRDDLKIGASVSLEGVCMSVTKIDGNIVGFDAMDATLERTNLGTFEEGQGINVERSMKPTDENGGHNVAGHVSCTAEIVAIKSEGPNAMIRFKVPEEWAKYIFVRGFLAVNGASLTVAEAEGNVFTIYLIPETMRQTTFGTYKVGDRLNIEVEQQTMVTVNVMERTLERLLPQYLAQALARPASAA